MNRRNFWLIFDLDGTVSNCAARMEQMKASQAHAEYEELMSSDFTSTSPACHEARQRMYDIFHAECGDDPVHTAEQMLIQAWVQAGGRAACITARPYAYEPETVKWLWRYSLPNAIVRMRPAGNTEPSHVLKPFLLQELIRRFFGDNDEVAMILDDHPEVVKVFRDQGYTVLQPRDGYNV